MHHDTPHPDLDIEDLFDDDFADEVQHDIQQVIENLPSLILRFGEWHLDTSGYKSSISKDTSETVFMEPETPISPLVITSYMTLGAPEEAFVQRVLMRLEALAAEERFLFVKRKWFCHLLAN